MIQYIYHMTPTRHSGPAGTPKLAKGGEGELWVGCCIVLCCNIAMLAFVDFEIWMRVWLWFRF